MPSVPIGTETGWVEWYKLFIGNTNSKHTHTSLFDFISYYIYIYLYAMVSVYFVFGCVLHTP